MTALSPLALGLPAGSLDVQPRSDARRDAPATATASLLDVPRPDATQRDEHGDPSVPGSTARRPRVGSADADPLSPMRSPAAARAQAVAMGPIPLSGAFAMANGDAYSTIPYFKPPAGGAPATALVDRSLRSPPPRFDASGLSVSTPLGYAGFDAGGLEIQPTLVSGHAGLDVYVGDRWLSAGPTIQHGARQWSLVAGGWGGPDSFVLLGGNVKDVAGYVVAGVNRAVRVRRVRSTTAGDPCVALPRDDDPERAYHISVVSRVSGGIRSAMLKHWGLQGGLGRLDIQAGSLWEWSTLASRATARRVLRSSREEGSAAAVANKAKAIGLCDEDVPEPPIHDPSSMRVGDQVTLLQEGSFSLGLAIGTLGLFGGTHVQAHGAVRTTIVKVSDEDVMVVREPLRVDSVAGYLASPLAPQLALTKTDVRAGAQAFVFHLDPTDPDTPAQRAYLDALDGDLPSALDRTAWQAVLLRDCSPTDPRSDDCHALAQRLIRDERTHLPKGVERVMLNSVVSSAKGWYAGAFLIGVPQGCLPKGWVNAWGRVGNRFEHGSASTFSAACGNTTQRESIAGKRADRLRGHRGQAVTCQYATAQWTQFTPPPSGPAEDTAIAATAHFNGLLCCDVSDVAPCRDPRLIAADLSRTYGTVLPAADPKGAREEHRRVVLTRSLSSKDIEAVARRTSPGGAPLGNDECVAICRRTGLDSRALSRLGARMKAAFDATDPTGTVQRQAGCLQDFVARHGRAAIATLHHLAGGRAGDLDIVTETTLFSDPLEAADRLEALYTDPVQPTDDDALERFEQIADCLLQIEGEALPSLPGEPFLGAEAKKTLEQELLAAAVRLRSMASVEHLSPAERADLAERMRAKLDRDADSTPGRRVLQCVDTEVEIARCARLQAEQMRAQATPEDADTLIRRWRHVHRLRTRLVERLDEDSRNPLLTEEQRRQRADRVADALRALGDDRNKTDAGGTPGSPIGLDRLDPKRRRALQDATVLALRLPLPSQHPADQELVAMLEAEREASINNSSWTCQSSHGG